MGGLADRRAPRVLNVLTIVLISFLLLTAPITAFIPISSASPTATTGITSQQEGGQNINSIGGSAYPNCTEIYGHKYCIQNVWAVSNEVAPGETVTIRAEVKNEGQKQGTIKSYLGIRPPGRDKSYPDSAKTYDIAVGETVVIDFQYTVPEDNPLGEYEATVDVWTGNDADMFHTSGWQQLFDVVDDSGDIEGRVTDSNGDPIDGARVYLGASTETRTDSNGEYAFSDVQAGNYEVEILAGACYNNPQRTVTIEGGQTTTENFQLSGEAYTIQLDSEPINVDTSGGGTYGCGSEVTISAPDTDGNYEFSHWEAQDGVTFSEEATFTFSYLTNSRDLTAQYKQAGKPDLTIADIDWDPSSPIDGDSVTFSADIENQGEARASSFAVEVFVENDVLRITDIDLGPGESKTIDLPEWDAVEGSYDVSAEVDYEDSVDEEDESNNVYSSTISIDELTGAVQGQITDEGGNPIEGARVYLGPSTETRTDSNGEYAFSGVEPGDYEMEVLAGSCYNNPTKAVTVDGDQSTPQDFQLTAESYTIQLDSEPINVDTSGSGTYDCGSEVTISAPSEDGNYEFSHWEAQDGETFSDQATYTFSYLTNNRDLTAQYTQGGRPDLTIADLHRNPSSPVDGDGVTFSVDLENQGEARASSFDVELTVENDVLRLENIDLGPGETKTVELPQWDAAEGSYDVSAEIDYQDTVDEEDESNNGYSTSISVDSSTGTVRGQVTDRDGDPIDGARVYLDTTWETRTSSDGGYSFSGIEPGTYEVEIEAGACYNNPAKTVTIEKGSAATQNFQLNAESYTIQLDSEPASVDYSGGGTYDCGSEVTISAPSTSGNYEFSHWEAQDGETFSEQATYTFSYLTNNRDLTAQYKQTGKPDLTISDIDWSPSSPADGDSVTFSVDIENQGEARASGFVVELSVENNVLRRTDINLEPGESKTVDLPEWDAVEGSYEISAEVDYEDSVDEEDESNNEETNTIRIDASTGTVQGRVTNPEGEPIPNVDVQLNGDNTVQTDSDGEYVFSNVPVGDHTIEAEKADYNSDSTTFSISGGGTVTQDLTLSKVSEPDISVLSLQISPEDPEEDQGVEVSFEVSNEGDAAAETFTVTSQIGNRQEEWTDITLEPGEAQEFTYQWTADPAVDQVSATADSGDTVEENTEQNNQELDSISVEDVIDQSTLSLSAQTENGEPAAEVTGVVIWQDKVGGEPFREFTSDSPVVFPKEVSLPINHEYLVTTYVQDQFAGKTDWFTPPERSRFEKRVTVRNRQPVQIRATYSNGDPLPDAQVRIKSHEDTVWREDTTNNDGFTQQFYLYPPNRGNYTVEIVRESAVVGSKTLSTLESGGAISVETNIAGPEPEVSAYLTSVTGLPDRYQEDHAYTTEIRVENTGEADHTFSVRLPERSGIEVEGQDTKEIELESGEVGSLEYEVGFYGTETTRTVVVFVSGEDGNRLDRGEVTVEPQLTAELTVTAVDGDGNPLPEAEVSVGSPALKTSSLEGEKSITFQEVPVGEYVISVETGDQTVSETLGVGSDNSQLNFQIEETTITGTVENVEGSSATITIGGQSAEIDADGGFTISGFYDSETYTAEITSNGITYEKQVNIDSGAENSLSLTTSQQEGRFAVLTELKDILLDDGKLTEVERSEVRSVVAALKPADQGFVFGDFGQKYPELIPGSGTVPYFTGWMIGAVTPGVDVITDARDCGVWVKGGTVQTAADTLDCGGAIVNTVGTATAWSGVGAAAATAEEVTDVVSITSKFLAKNPEKVREVGSRLAQVFSKEKAIEVANKLKSVAGDKVRRIKAAIRSTETISYDQAVNLASRGDVPYENPYEIKKVADSVENFGELSKESQSALLQLSKKSDQDLLNSVRGSLDSEGILKLAEADNPAKKWNEFNRLNTQLKSKYSKNKIFTQLDSQLKGLNHQLSRKGKLKHGAEIKFEDVDRIAYHSGRPQYIIQSNKWGDSVDLVGDGMHDFKHIVARHANPKSANDYDWPVTPGSDLAESVFPKSMGPQEIKDVIEIGIRNGNTGSNSGKIVYSGSELSEYAISEIIIRRNPDTGVIQTAYPN